MVKRLNWAEGRHHEVGRVKARKEDVGPNDGSDDAAAQRPLTDGSRASPVTRVERK